VDTSVLSAEVTRDSNTCGQSSGTRATDLYVDALLVELRTTNAITLVEGNDLGADDVLARCNLGQSELVLSWLASV